MMGIGGMMGPGGGQMPNISQMRERMFQRADTDGDKGLSLEEFSAAGKNMPGGASRTDQQNAEAFGKIDADRNGSVSQDEMRVVTDRMSDQMRSMMVQMQSMMSGGGGGGPDLSALFGKADGDGDKAVSRKEFDQATRDNPLAQLMGGKDGQDPFKKIDADGDGSLSREEFDQFGEQMRERMQGAGRPSLDALMQANQAYGQQGRNGQSTDLTQTLLQALDGKDGRQGASRQA